MSQLEIGDLVHVLNNREEPGRIIHIFQDDMGETRYVLDYAHRSYALGVYSAYELILDEHDKNLRLLKAAMGVEDEV